MKYRYEGPVKIVDTGEIYKVNIITEAINQKSAINNILSTIQNNIEPHVEKSKIGLKSSYLTEEIEVACSESTPVREQILMEDTRVVLANKSRTIGFYKDQSHGKNRFDRKRFSRVATSVKEYNKIDMNELFKHDTLQVGIPVLGETDTYLVEVKMEGVIEELAKGIKANKGKLEYKNVIQALTKIFNTKDIFIKCSCPDYKYRFAHWNIINNVSVDDTAHDPGPGKGIANPNDDKGRGCKHVLLVLANGDWMMKVASVINNYIHYASEHMQKPFLKLIFPKLYGCSADEAAEVGLVETSEDLESKTDLIKVINDWARDRGKFKKGSNVNPVQADELEAQQKAEKAKAEAEAKKQAELERAEKEAELRKAKEAEKEKEVKEQPKEEETD